MRKYLVAFLIPPMTLVFAAIALLCCFSFTKELPTKVMQRWGKTLVWMTGIRLQITGLEQVDPKRPAIYMANHASMIDIPVLIAALPVNLRFIFKQSILFVPLVGLAIYAMGMIPIDRSNRKKASRSLFKAAERIRNGYHVLIFPEGTRTKTGELLPFKKGGFVLAHGEHIDIVPITIKNSLARVGRTSLLATPGPLEIVIHERIPAGASGKHGRDVLVQKVRDAIEMDMY